jgi:hypothetical protein
MLLFWMPVEREFAENPQKRVSTRDEHLKHKTIKTVELNQNEMKAVNGGTLLGLLGDDSMIKSVTQGIYRCIAYR